jgi:hypothetical protein
MVCVCNNTLVYFFYSKSLHAANIYTTLSTKRFPPNYGTMGQSTISIFEIKKMLGGEE